MASWLRESVTYLLPAISRGCARSRPWGRWAGSGAIAIISPSGLLIPAAGAGNHPDPAGLLVMDMLTVPAAYSIVVVRSSNARLALAR